MPSTSAKDSVALVIDDGLFVHVAASLAGGFKKVLYGLALRGTAPKACLSFIGRGLPNVDRVDDIYEAAERADVVILPDVYTADLALHFRKLGKPVFGATPDIAALELDRWRTRQLIRDSGLPVVKAKRVVGIDALEASLKDSTDKWVKGLRYRGDFETFHHTDYFMSRPWLHDLKSRLGPTGAAQVFIVEDPIDDAVEVGIDAAVVNGQFPDTVSYGYEDKGAGYVGRVCAYEKLPKPIREVSEKFRWALAGYTGFLSLEIRVTKDGVPYFIDPACRAGLPPSESYMELFSNWPEFVFQAAHGKRIDLEPAGKFSAQVQMTGDFARDHYMAWDIPSADLRWVKLQNHFRQNGVDYNCPNGDTLVGAVTAVGNSVEEVEAACLRRASGVKAYSLEYDEGAFPRLQKATQKGQQYGVDWT